jgi:hypothetical protein
MLLSGSGDDLCDLLLPCLREWLIDCLCSIFTAFPDGGICHHIQLYFIEISL